MAPVGLYERERQLGAADRCLAEARAGRSRALFLVGEAGLGKTALLDEIERDRTQRGWRVARGRCDPMEASLAFGVLSQVVHSLGGPHDRLSPPGGLDEDREATWFRMLRWIAASARSSADPLLLMVDDLHSADPDSLAFMGFLCRRLTGLPIAVIATLRGWPLPATDVARGLVSRGDAVVESLSALSRESAALVLAGQSREPVSAGAVTRAWRLSGGNPLLIELLAAAGGESGETPQDDVSVPVGARSLVLSRFSALSEAATTWARAAAVLGVGFRHDVVREVSGLDHAAADAAAEEVWRNGLAREVADGGIAFVHPLFAQLLYEDLMPSTRTRLHERAFTALLQRGSSDLAAEHAIRAHLAGDARAIEVLSAAGRRALAAGAPATAATRLEGAVHLAGDRLDPVLLRDLGVAQMSAGRLTESAATTGRLLDTDLGVRDRIRAMTMLSQARFAMGDFDGAEVALRSAATLAEQDAPDEGVLPLIQHATATLMTRGPAAALAIADRARALAAPGDPDLAVRANASWGLLAYFCGDPAGLTAAQSQGAPLLARASTDWAADLRTGSSVITPFAGTASLAGHFEVAEAAFQAGIDAADAAGAVRDVVGLQIGYGLMLLRTRADQSLAVADSLLSVIDLVPLAEPFARTIRSHALLHQGDERASAEEARRAESVAGPFGLWQCQLLLRHRDGIRLLRAGRAEEASDTYREVERTSRDLGLGEPCTIHYARHAVLAHTMAGRTQDAARVLADLDADALRLSCTWIVAAAAAGHAALAQSRGETGRADAHFVVAIDTLAGTPLLMDRAEVLIEHGTMLRRDGRPREARDSFRSAMEAAESAGARWLEARAAEELAAAGGRRTARRSPRDLTPQERRVARLAATGASDKEIAAGLTVSVRTVRTHLENIYRKLDIHSRRELMTRGETAGD